MNDTDVPDTLYDIQSRIFDTIREVQALRNELKYLQLQYNDSVNTIQEIQGFCAMVREILEKEGVLSLGWQKDAQPVTDDFKNLEGVL